MQIIINVHILFTVLLLKLKKLKKLNKNLFMMLDVDWLLPSNHSFITCILLPVGVLEVFLQNMLEAVPL